MIHRQIPAHPTRKPHLRRNDGVAEIPAQPLHTLPTLRRNDGKKSIHAPLWYEFHFRYSIYHLIFFKEVSH